MPKPPCVCFMALFLQPDVFPSLLSTNIFNRAGPKGVTGGDKGVHFFCGQVFFDFEEKIEKMKRPKMGFFRGNLCKSVGVGAHFSKFAPALVFVIKQVGIKFENRVFAQILSNAQSFIKKFKKVL